MYLLSRHDTNQISDNLAKNHTKPRFLPPPDGRNELIYRFPACEIISFQIEEDTRVDLEIFS